MENQPAAPQPGRAPFESAFKLFKPSTETVMDNIGTLLGLTFLPLAPTVLTVIIVIILEVSHAPVALSALLALLAFISMLVLICWCGVALIKALLAATRGEHPTIKAMLHESRGYIWRFVGLGIVLDIVYIVSALLLVVPLFFSIRRYLLASYYMIDRNLSIFDAMKQSAHDSKQYSSELWGVIGVQMLFAVPCLVPFIGSIATIVLEYLYSCAPAKRYLQISEAEHGGGMPPVPTTTPVAPKPSIQQHPPVQPRPLIQ